MRTDLFGFDLPPESIALRPASPRDSAKMLVVQGDGALRDGGVSELPQWLQPGDQLVVNDTRVISAQLKGRRIGREKRRAFRDETYWSRPVPGFGDPSARLLIVGLAPAAHGANRTGRVFTGDGPGGSGDFLMSALHRAGFANIPTCRHPDDGLQLTDAFIAAAVRCAPPDNRPTPEEIVRCLPHLAAITDKESVRPTEAVLGSGGDGTEPASSSRLRQNG